MTEIKRKPFILDVRKKGKTTYRATVKQGSNTPHTEEGGIGLLALGLWDKQYMLQGLGETPKDHKVIDEVTGSGADAIQQAFQKLYKTECLKPEIAQLEQLVKQHANYRTRPQYETREEDTIGTPTRYTVLLWFHAGNPHARKKASDYITSAASHKELEPTKAVEYENLSGFNVTSTLGRLYLEDTIREIIDQGRDIRKPWQFEVLYWTEPPMESDIHQNGKSRPYEIILELNEIGMSAEINRGIDVVRSGLSDVCSEVGPPRGTEPRKVSIFVKSAKDSEALTDNILVSYGGLTLFQKPKDQVIRPI